MLKTKHTIVFIVILLCILYQLLSSFNIVPYFITGQDMMLVLILLVSLLILLIGHSVIRMSGKRISAYEEISIGSYADAVQRPELDSTKHFEEKDFCKYFIAMQNYLSIFSDTKELIDKLLVAAARVTHSDRASILLYDRKKDELFINRTLGWNENEIRLIRNTRIRPGEGIAGRVFLDGKPVVMNESEAKGEFEVKDKYRSNSFVSFPLLSGNSVIGVLNLTEKEKGAYTKSEIEMVRFILNEAAMHLSYLMKISKERFY
jgi:transcriptional regulator with GAF, ATPase, and Fis domain